MSQTYRVIEVDPKTGAERVVIGGLSYEMAGAVAEVSPIHPRRRIEPENDAQKEDANEG